MIEMVKSVEVRLAMRTEVRVVGGGEGGGEDGGSYRDD